jgi:RNA polymerase sigma-70 factor (ECF subfamily)
LGVNVEEWPLIVRQHSALVWRTAYRLLAHPADTADCFQETFVSAWEIARRQEIKNWGGLLQRLATVRALDQLRRRCREAKHVGGPLNGGETPSAAAGPLAQVQSMELAGQLRRALADLPKRQSQAYCLRHLNGFSYEQIADELQISLAAVGVNLHRASSRLRAALTPIVTDGRDKR